MRHSARDGIDVRDDRVVSLGAYKQARQLIKQDAHSAARIAAVMAQAQRNRLHEGHWREVQMWVARLRIRRG